ncbi:MAG: right-handed parallel beta-helix repeat-containing protein [Candidatus Hodarchaeota archaeon]
MSLENSSYSIIANNTCSYHFDPEGFVTGGDGIHVRESDNIIIIKNTYNNNGMGISLYRINLSTVSDNICNNTGNSGIFLQRENYFNLVVNNSCSYNNWAGIVSGGDWGSCSHSIIT